MTARRDKTDRRMRRLVGRANPRRGLRGLPHRLGLTRVPRSPLALGLLILGSVLALWGAFDIAGARRDLQVARDDLSAAAQEIGRATDADATGALRSATRHAVARTLRARTRLQRAPLVRALAVVPFVRTQRRDLLRAVNVAHTTASTGDELAVRIARVRAGLVVKNASVDLAALDTLADAAADAGRTLDDLPRTHRGGQWGPLASATRDLDDVVTDTATRLTNGAGTMRVAHRLLGRDGPARVFIALLNNAEMRDQGMVLSYAVAETRDGELRVARSGSIGDLALPAPVTDVTLPRGTAITFGQLAPLQIWQSVNATADTAVAGRSMAAMYRAATGDPVDGVLALDVPAVAALLSVTGPVSVAGISQPITSGNAAELLLNDLYASQDNTEAAREARQAQLAGVTAALVERIRSTSLDASALVRALGESAAGGHVWVASGREDEQATLERAGLGGRPGRVAPERTIHVAVQNGTASKLDWFVDPVVDVDVTVTPDGTAVVRTTVDIPNDAPIGARPSEQFGPDNIITTVPGQYRGRVYFWGPSNGDQIDSVEESGLRLSFATADVLPQQRASVGFLTTLTDAVVDDRLRLRFVPQARVRPMQLRVSVHGPGWKVTPQDQQSRAWDATIELSWRLHR